MCPKTELTLLLDDDIAHLHIVISNPASSLAVFLLTKAELENFPCQMALAKISIVYARSRYNQNGIEIWPFFGQIWSSISYKTLYGIFMRGLNFLGLILLGDQFFRGPNEIGDHFSTSLRVCVKYIVGKVGTK